MALTDRDEDLHDPPVPTPSHWQENLFFICWDLDSDSGLLCHIQRAPARDFQEASIVVVVGGDVASVTVEGPWHRDALPEGVHARPVDPFRRWEVRIATTGAAGVGPLGMLATASGDTVIEVDLELRSDLPVADFAEGLAAVVAGMRAAGDGPQMGDQEHYEQGGTFTGCLRVGDRSIETSGLFVRDHSWGIRNEHQDFRAFWTAACLDEGRVFCNAIGIPRDDGVLGIGVIVDAAGARFTTDVDATFHPTAGISEHRATTVRFGSPLDTMLTAETRIHVPILLPHSGPRRYDDNAISAVRIGDLTGFGVMEWASVLTDAQVAELEAGRANQPSA